VQECTKQVQIRCKSQQNLVYRVDHDFRRIMKLVSYFSEVRLIYYEFSKIKSISKINKGLSKKKNHRGDTWQHRDVPHGMLMSSSRQRDVTKWVRLLTLAVGPVDISIDQVNMLTIDRDNRWGLLVRWALRVSLIV